MKDEITTVLRLRTRVKNPIELQDELVARSLIPGVIVAYVEGDYVISLHKDSIPESPDNNTAKRVNAIIKKD